MKSLVEEASSVVKALEKAWQRAGKPQNFSVKVFEEAQSGFLGFNSSPAKVGIFFEEEKKQKEYPNKRHEQVQKDFHQKPEAHKADIKKKKEDTQKKNNSGRSKNTFKKTTPKKREFSRPKKTFEKKEEQKPENVKKQAETTDGAKPIPQEQTQSSVASKKVLKVSSRRYHAPAKSENDKKELSGK